VAYIDLIFHGKEFTDRLAYHSIERGQSSLEHCNWTHELSLKDITKHHVKIYFDDSLELILLNWFYKFFVKPESEDWIHTVRNEWQKSQKKHWAIYGDHWNVRAVLRWMYNIDVDPNYKSKISFPGKNFCGNALYNGYDIVKEEFGKHDVDYTKEKYERWYESQESIIKSWKYVKNIHNIDEIKKLNYFFERGVALGLYGLKNKLTEEVAWKDYIK